MSDFKDKVVFITGGSRGIGRACALQFAKRGATIVINYAGNEAAATETVKLVTDLGCKAKALRFDVSNTEEVNKAIDDTVKEFTRIDVLVNNAGVAVDGLIMRFADADYSKTLDTNLKGAFNLIRAVSRPMMKQRAGVIINMTSIVGEMGNAGQAAYAASKAGLIGLTKAMAKELAPRNIRVNAVSPGFIETDMTTHIPEEAKKMMLQVTPLARLGKADEVAAATVFLASNDASYITGEVLKVNGGMYM
ncbi:MAG: 3-oxoacyl-[acyl-carrier-protein] reductase [Myxococcaceae bacterium]|nr:3-oxoacyl-[acyl-carrier-protein] reductase [Myxococcaceae bacterium]